MGTLTGYLQRAFAEHCPPGWTAHAEVPLLSSDLAALLGYAPHADVVLERAGGSRRLWIEFEVSRADPVANHAKFATAHLFQPQLAGETFLSMVSPHVARGRRNLAANTVSLMRRVGMSAFQTVLFPHLPAGEIKRLNHLDPSSAGVSFPTVAPEIERAFAVADPVATVSGHRVHLVGDILDVLLNVRRWNEEVATPEGRALWGKRTVTYFVFDPHSRQFAPAKFCAYLPLPTEWPIITSTSRVAFARATMTMPLYASLDGTDTRFDGHRAQRHLTSGIGMGAVPAGQGMATTPGFASWLEQHDELVTLHPAGPVVLTVPDWFG
jgi:hypothetical protein